MRTPRNDSGRRSCWDRKVQHFVKICIHSWWHRWLEDVLPRIVLYTCFHPTTAAFQQVSFDFCCHHHHVGLIVASHWYPSPGSSTSCCNWTGKSQYQRKVHCSSYPSHYPWLLHWLFDVQRDDACKSKGATPDRPFNPRQYGCCNISCVPYLSFPYPFVLQIDLPCFCILAQENRLGIGLLIGVKSRRKRWS